MRCDNGLPGNACFARQWWGVRDGESAEMCRAFEGDGLAAVPQDRSGGPEALPRRGLALPCHRSCRPGYAMTASADDSVIAGRYRLIAPIGSGGGGTVYRALDTLLEREVAVKKVQLIFAANEAPSAEIFQRTFREARAAARINHPGVAAVYDVVSDADRPCIVMQLIEGPPLSELLAEQGPLPPYRVADIGRQVLAALTAGHAVGVLHRDLKPGNVLITLDWRAVLTDFGIASVAGDPAITRTGVVLGTPSYVAPERVKGEAATPAADLWSLGATLYAAIQGRGPYDDATGLSRPSTRSSPETRPSCLATSHCARSSPPCCAAIRSVGLDLTRSPTSLTWPRRICRGHSAPGLRLRPTCGETPSPRPHPRLTRRATSPPRPRAHPASEGRRRSRPRMRP